MPNNKYRTPERNQLVAALWATETPVAEIKRQIDLLDGIPVPLNAIGPWAYSMGLRRPRGYVSKINKAAGAKTAIVLTRSTPERDALLTELWTSGAFKPAIVIAINCLPGPPVTERYIEHQASKLGLRRPPEYLAAVRRIAARSPRPVRQAVVVPAPVAVPAPNPAPTFTPVPKGTHPVQRFSMLGGAIRG